MNTFVIHLNIEHNFKFLYLFYLKDLSFSSKRWKFYHFFFSVLLERFFLQAVTHATLQTENWWWFFTFFVAGEENFLIFSSSMLRKLIFSHSFFFEIKRLLHCMLLLNLYSVLDEEKLFFPCDCENLRSFHSRSLSNWIFHETCRK